MPITICAKVPKEKAERVRSELQRMGLIDHSYNPKARGKFVFFPVKQEAEGLQTVRTEMERRAVRPQSLDEALRKVGIEPKGITKSFDMIGGIAIVDIPPKLVKHEKRIARAIMKLHPNVQTVAKKAGPVSGVYRLRKVKVIVGKKDKETIHTESGCRFKLDVEKAYFSPRLSFERQRIASLVKSGEVVFVPFAGVGPFAIVIARLHPDTKIYANELNPVAFRYMEENVRLNKVANITLVAGDARGLSNTYRNTADRIVMPIPMSADKFLDVAFALAKKGAVAHFYFFTKSQEEAVKPIERFAKKARRRIKILGIRTVREYSPVITEYVVDFKML